jgi:hypothetical protein
MIPHGGRIRRLHRDQRGLITGFLIRLIIAFLIVGAVGEEAAQCVIAQVKAHSTARVAAQAAANEFFLSKSHQRAEDVAIAAAAAENPAARVTGFSIAQDGTVTVTTVVTATTWIVKRVSFLKHLGIQHGTEQETHST